MAHTEYKKVLELSGTEVRKKLGESREELREARFQVSQGQLKKHRVIRTIRTRIAQALTAVNANKKN